MGNLIRNILLDMRLWYLYVAIASPFICWVMYKRWKWFSKWPMLWIVWNGVLTMVLAVVLTASGNMLTNHRLRSSSQTDISPLLMLHENAANYVSEALAALAEDGLIRVPRIQEFSDHSRLIRRYDTGWVSEGNNSNFSSSWIRVTIYHEEEVAISRVQRSYPDPSSQYFSNENRTSANLRGPWMTSDQYLRILVNNRRNVNIFRIGNVYFWMRENYDWRDGDPGYSSQFISALVEMINKLQQE